MNGTVGSTYQSNADVHISKEGFYLGKTNAYGFIGDLGSYSKNNFNIAFFGDSFTEAFQLFEPYNFTSITEIKLNKVQSTKVDVLNFGISNVLLKDIYIRKKMLASKFDIDLNVYFVDNIQFVDYPEGVLNSLDLKIEKEKIQVVESKSSSYLLYQKIHFLVDKSSYTNLFLDLYLLHKRGLAYQNIFDKFIQNKGSTIFDTRIVSENMFENMPMINSKILAELAKENTVFIFKETIDPDVEKLLLKHQILFFETKPTLDSMRDSGMNPYYWERTQTMGHFNYVAHEKLASFMTGIILPCVKK
ncbi:SGNH/GDSL hydrolase family protein [Flavobacterium sp. XN-5]|uniref:SGNH/GDSL hydrolase family protein n=1 Tax=Flavobacterium sp. XN-5 TaxID=2599390 RepID=UPI0011C94ED1|nr:SGNH/GDSL hydrolase family protein [Flavobacterium sp. XN-5]NGY36575.1 SGNH/GDSL hydrolase family protein [Flavobacterium sp. XN-5]